MIDFYPLISIIIPVYRGANFLSEAINSALKQTYSNIEIIVVNDGSDDNGETEKVALSYGDKIRYLYKNNGGIASALNCGIKNMNGEYFSWLSHDDLYEPEKIEKQVALIASPKDIIHCSGYLIDEHAKKIPWKIKTLSGLYSGNELFRQCNKGYILNGLGFLVPKTVFDQIGGFDETLRYMQDTDMWFRIMQLDYSFVCQNDLLVASRMHCQQTTNLLKNIEEADRIKLAEKHFALINAAGKKDKIKKMKSYYLYFVKNQTKVGIDLFKNELLSENEYDLITILSAYSFYLRGKLKCLFRKVYNSVFRLVKLRD